MSSQREFRRNIPRRFARIADAVSDRDRAWFDAHPDEDRYVRPYVPGEMLTQDLIGHPMPSQDAWVLVTRLAPGLRSRQPIELLVLQVPGSQRIRVHLPGTDEVIDAAFEQG